VPIDVDFTIPFPPKRPPDAAAAEEHAVQWLCSHGLLRSPEQKQYFISMRVGAAAAFLYPHSTGADLHMAADTIALTALINDQVDSSSNQRAQHATEICNDLVTLLRNNRPAGPTTAIGSAWCTLWPRLADGMSMAWQERARRHLSQFFGAYMAPRTMLNAAQYLERRRTLSGLKTWLDLAERTSHFELPEPARNAALISDLFEEAVKLFNLPHDVFAVEREEARGEVDNMVLVLEHATGRPRPRVITEIRSMVDNAGERFLELESHLPEIGCALTLSPSDRNALAFYVQAMRDIVRGNYDWHKQGTARYDPKAADLAIASGYEDTRLPHMTPDPSDAV